MNKYKKLLVVSVLALVFLPVISHATSTLVISEIFYDAPGTDTDHEWIEVHNISSSPVTLIGGSGSGSWRFNDGANHFLADGATHGSMTIAPNGYAVIAGNADVFMSDHSGFSGTVIDTTMSLPNTGGTVKIIDGNGIPLDSVTYSSTQHASGDGNSLQLGSDGTWIAATPTPGSATTGTTSGTGDTGAVGGIASTPAPPNTKAYEPQEIKASISLPSAGTVGMPVTVSTIVLGYSGEFQENGAFHYAFGDGTEFENGFLRPVTHIYKYPGTYVVVFTYRTNTYVRDPEVTARQVIEVTAPAVVISRVYPDGAIELKNPGGNESDISNWSLVSTASIPEKVFKIPAGTIVLAGKTIVLPTELTGFTQPETKQLNLVLSSGNMASSYPATTTPVTTIVHTQTETVPQTGVHSSVASKPTPDVTTLDSELSANVLGATSLQETESTHAKKVPTILFLIVGILGVLGASGIAVWHFRLFPKNVVANTETEVTDTEKIANSIRIVEDEEI